MSAKQVKETDESIEQFEKLIGKDAEQKEEANELTSSDMLGGTIKFNSLHLRPVTLSTLAMLEKLKSPLVTGEEEGADMITEALVFMWLQSAPKNEVRAAVLSSKFDDRISIEAKALELGDDLGIENMDEMVDVVGKMMTEAQKNKVETIPDDEDLKDKRRKPSKNK